MLQMGKYLLAKGLVSARAAQHTCSQRKPSVITQAASPRRPLSYPPRTAPPPDCARLRRKSMSTYHTLSLSLLTSCAVSLPD